LVANPQLNGAVNHYSYDGMTIWIFRFIFLGMILLPFSTNPGDKSVVISFGLPFLAIAAVISFLFLIYSNRPFNANLKGVLWSSCLYVGFIALFSMFSPERLPSFGRSIPHVIGLLIFIFILSFSNDSNKAKSSWINKFIITLVLSGTILSVYYVANFSLAAFHKSFIEVIFERFVGGLMSLPWGASNTIAATLIMPLVVTLASIHMSTGYKYCKYIVVVIIIIAILATLSRTVLVLLLYIFLIQSILARSSKYIAYFILIVMVPGILLFYFNKEGLDAISQTRVNVDTITSLSGRAEIWKEFAEYISRNPLSPIGYYGSQYLFGYSGHNTLLTTMVELGIFGILITIVFYANLLTCSLKAILNSNTEHKNIYIILFVGLTAILLNLMNEDPNYTQQYIIYFWFFSGILCLSSGTDFE